MKPVWYVVLYAASPPLAVPVSMAAVKDAYCKRLNAAKRAFVVYEVAEASSRERRRLEALLSVSADERMRALVALNRMRIADNEWRSSFWGCSVCDGSLDRPTACGCCERPDCAVRCGCRCLREFAICPDCGSRVTDCTCLGEDEMADLSDEVEDWERGTLEDCMSCGREFRSYGSPWCDGCIALDEEWKQCMCCEREPKGRCPQCDGA